MEKGGRVKIDLNTNAKIVLLFAGAGAAVGAVSAFLHSLLALGFAFLVFVVLIYNLAPKILKLGLKEYPPIKLFKTGFLPLFVIWLIGWIMVYSTFVAGR